MKAQRARIKKWLESGKPITPLNALQAFGCFRLGARIWELRKEGLPIRTDFVQKGRQRYARYSLQ
jgi:hypothetical protein